MAKRRHSAMLLVAAAGWGCAHAFVSVPARPAIGLPSRHGRALGAPAAAILPSSRPAAATKSGRRVQLQMQFDPNLALSAVEPADYALKDMLSYPQTWWLILQFGVLALGQTFEWIVEAVEDNVDPRVKPVVTQSVIEFATLGFIGLVIQTLELGGHESFLSQVSKTYLGDGEELFEQFELLHDGLFFATIGFFASCGTIVYRSFPLSLSRARAHSVYFTFSTTFSPCDPKRSTCNPKTPF